MKVKLLKDALIVVNKKKSKRKAGAVVSVPDPYGEYLIQWKFAELAGDTK